jgi:hypothetical protein
VQVECQAAMALFLKMREDLLLKKSVWIREKLAY